MKKFLKFKFVFIICAAVFLIVVGLEIQDDYRQYGKFRTMQDPIESTGKVDLTGLRELQIAGGPVLPFPQLQEKIGNVKANKKIMVDGIGRYGYIYGLPADYLGYTSSPSAIRLLWRLFYTGTLQKHPELIIPESKEAEKYGFEYVSFKIKSKVASSDQVIDSFIKFLDTLPKNTWVYFHCHHGKGRTSIMLVMADILKNAPKVPLEDIVKRQYLLGSVDLFDTTHWKNGTYAVRKLEKRKQFIKKFYDFVCQRKAGGVQLWSDWHRQMKSKNERMTLSREKR